MEIGHRVLFKQECTNILPPDFPNGVVLFENVVDQKERFSVAVEFRDTVVVSVTYYLKANQYAILDRIGYSNVKGNGSAIKGQWTYNLQEEKRHTTIVGDRKRIVVVQTI